VHRADDALIAALAADGIAYDRQAVAGDAAAYRQFVELLVPLVRGCWNPPSPFGIVK